MFTSSLEIQPVERSDISTPYQLPASLLMAIYVPAFTFARVRRPVRDARMAAPRAITPSLPTTFSVPGFGPLFPGFGRPAGAPPREASDLPLDGAPCCFRYFSNCWASVWLPETAGPLL